MEGESLVFSTQLLLRFPQLQKGEAWEPVATGARDYWARNYLYVFCFCPWRLAIT